MKKLFFAIIVVSFVGFTALFLFIITGCFSIFMSEPPKPATIYGEFPFSITFERDGKTFEYEDVIICEYNGVESLGTAGKYNVWNGKLKSGNDRIVLLQEENDGLLFEVYMPIPGLPEYYMGDFRQDRKYYEEAMKDHRYLGYCQWDDDIIIKDISVSAEEVWEKYHIKIIDVTYPEPIENHFE